MHREASIRPAGNRGASFLKVAKNCCTLGL
jgi:hypothetical protein